VIVSYTLGGKKCTKAKVEGAAGKPRERESGPTHSMERI